MKKIIGILWAFAVMAFAALAWLVAATFFIVN